MRGFVLVRDRETALRNLKGNWLFPLCGSIFILTQIPDYYEFIRYFIVSTIIGAVVLTFIAAQYPEIWRWTRGGSRLERGLLALNTLGLSLPAYERVRELSARVRTAPLLGVCVACVCCAASFIFLLPCVALFWRKLCGALKDSIMPDRRRGGVLLLLLLGTLVPMALVFSRTNAFYGIDAYDIIYTSDSGSIVLQNAYISLWHPENDLRQPLYAVFSAPFLGWAYLLSKFFPDPLWAKALLFNSVQIALILASYCMIARSMRLTLAGQVSFVLIACCSYPYLLFSLMMEQYAFVIFWTALSIFLLSEKKCEQLLPFYAATGTLLTSGVLLLGTSEASPRRDFKRWFWDMFRRGMTFVALMLACGRADVFLLLIPKIKSLIHFSGASVPWSGRLEQYLSFLYECCFAPAARSGINSKGRASWVVEPSALHAWLGVAVAALLIVSVIVNRRRRISRLSFGWVLFSFAMLCVMGWGTQENGLILYTLYFGWAVLALLFQLVEWLAKRLRARWLMPVACGAGIAALLAVNLPEMCRMIAFALETYPR